MKLKDKKITLSQIEFLEPIKVELKDDFYIFNFEIKIYTSSSSIISLPKITNFLAEISFKVKEHELKFLKLVSSPKNDLKKAYFFNNLPYTLTNSIVENVPLLLMKKGFENLQKILFSEEFKNLDFDIYTEENRNVIFRKIGSDYSYKYLLDEENNVKILSYFSTFFDMIFKFEDFIIPPGKIPASKKLKFALRKFD